jgi:hypothetical protein
MLYCFSDTIPLLKTDRSFPHSTGTEPNRRVVIEYVR